MIEHVVDLETSKLLSPYLEGYESEFIYTRYRVRLGMGDWDNWSEIELIPYEKYIASPDFVERELYPALLLSEVQRWFPKVMTVPARNREGYEVVWFTTQNGGARGNGRVGLMSYEDHVYSWYKKFDADIDENLTTAAGRLLLWTHQNGYIK
jgi:hypothetical protein